MFCLGFFCSYFVYDCVVGINKLGMCLECGVVFDWLVVLFGMFFIYMFNMNRVFFLWNVLMNCVIVGNNMEGYILFEVCDDRDMYSVYFFWFFL